MKRDGPKNIAASVQARLVERSRELGVEHQLTLARFGGERLLYRLSKSKFADRFILKGAALLLLSALIAACDNKRPDSNAASFLRAGFASDHNLDILAEGRQQLD